MNTFVVALSATLQVGQVKRLHLAALDVANRPVPVVGTITWLTDNPSVVTLQPNGVNCDVTAVAAGTCNIIAAVTLFSDNFNRIDSPSLGSNWTTVTHSTPPGTIGISSDKAVAAVSGSQIIALANIGAPTEDAIASVDVTLAGGAPIFTGGGVVLRADNADNAYVGMVLSDGAGGAFAALGIYRSGSLSLAALTSITPAASYTVQLSVVGTQLTLAINGAEVGSTADTTLEQPGGIGMIDIGGVSTFEDFTTNVGPSALTALTVIQPIMNGSPPAYLVIGEVI